MDTKEKLKEIEEALIQEILNRLQMPARGSLTPQDLDYLTKAYSSLRQHEIYEKLASYSTGVLGGDKNNV